MELSLNMIICLRTAPIGARFGYDGRTLRALGNRQIVRVYAGTNEARLTAKGRRYQELLKPLKRELLGAVYGNRKMLQHIQEGLK